MPFVAGSKMDWVYPRFHKESLAQTLCRSGLFVICVSHYGEKNGSVHQLPAQDLHHAGSPQTRYYWRGEIQESTEILMLVKTRTSKIERLTDYVKSVHPYETPELLTFPVEGGSLPYMKWMDEAVPDD
ncbi:protein CutA homolog isoform X2 [Esox lucius]|uniref:protein CutA homolog isoform X2 n=1 Tax=Esox lucius TaxID=8010 RepID=UPI001476BF38|nr:protein CutA homolog isoform X2 [Esox lucius]